MSLKLILALVFATASLLMAAQQLTPLEQHGKHIYTKTTSPSGKEITAFIGIASTEAPGSVMACVNCHGPDGQGRPEAGIDPGNITWKVLSRSYGVRHASGREHPPYTDETLARAIVKGIDPAGNKLNLAMPHYTMPEEDLAALIAYLRKLGTEMDPGLSESHIRIGTIVPSEGPSADLGSAIESTLQAYFAEMSEQGGVYSRRFELVVARGKGGLTRDRVSKFLKEQNVFALVSTFTPELDSEMTDLLEEETVPLVGPFTLFPTAEMSLNRFVFYVLSGLREQAKALVNFASGDGGAAGKRLTLLHPERTDLDEITAAVKEHGEQKGWDAVEVLRYPVGKFEAKSWVQRLKAEDVGHLLFFGVESETVSLLREAESAGWAPAFLLPGVLLGQAVNAIPPSLRERAFIAYPSLPEDRKETSLREFKALIDKHKLPTRHLGAQLSAYVAAQILVEGLRRSGKELSRERFIAMLEKMYRFDTGLTPLISYDPNRRIGALGSYIVVIDSRNDSFKYTGRWVGIE